MTVRDLQHRGSQPESSQDPRHQPEPVKRAVENEDHAARNDQIDVVRPVPRRGDHPPDCQEQVALRGGCLA